MPAAGASPFLLGIAVLWTVSASCGPSRLRVGVVPDAENSESPHPGTAPGMAGMQILGRGSESTTRNGAVSAAIVNPSTDLRAGAAGGHSTTSDPFARGLEQIEVLHSLLFRLSIFLYALFSLVRDVKHIVRKQGGWLLRELRPWRRRLTAAHDGATTGSRPTPRVRRREGRVRAGRRTGVRSARRRTPGAPARSSRPPVSTTTSAAPPVASVSGTGRA